MVLTSKKKRLRYEDSRLMTNVCEELPSGVRTGRPLRRVKCAASSAETEQVNVVVVVEFVFQIYMVRIATGLQADMTPLYVVCLRSSMR